MPIDAIDSLPISAYIESTLSYDADVSVMKRV